MAARATPAYWPAIESLLTSSALPLDGAAEAFATGLVERQDGELVGCVAIEPYDGSAVLRSVAVRDDRRGAGLGQALVHAAEDLAREAGATELILLTETAEPFFTRLGYEVIHRTSVSDEVAGSIEFSAACPTSAVAMRRHLD
jgi:amino-acid N-acetyltransferase